eukprot:339792-Pyramimonas_sp.AAC.1
MRRRPRRSNRKRGGRKVPTDQVSSGAAGCPAPLARGLPGQKQAGPYFPEASIDSIGGVNRNPSGGEFHHEYREQVANLVNILANFPYPLSRGAIK